MGRREVFGVISLLLIGGLAAATAAQAPPRQLIWTLKKAEILVRESVDGRYVVEAFMDYHPPPDAHPNLDAGALTIWFPGDAGRQELKLVTTRINGKEVLRSISASDPRGTQVYLRIEKENRVAPLAVHLMVVLRTVRGCVALPVSEPNDGAEVVIKKPDGSEWRPATWPEDLVVNEKEARGQDLPVLQLAIAGCFLATVVFVFVILRRRRGRD